ncbi:MAG: hypothetical protein ACI9CD_000732 [Candidatus Deianiraeaceae bacterium]|jgi:hypothetical protein
MQNELIALEKLEQKYLLKYYYFLKFTQDEILKGLDSKNNIKNDWFHKWNTADNEKKISDFNTGAERVIYALINSKGIGIPNSCPVGSDLMFEVDDAFIHIDLKTVQSSNIGDFTSSIFVGNNQISYNSTYIVNNKEREFGGANLPHFYTKNNGKQYCLTYFLSILHDSDTFETLCIYITCFPNGLLQPIYEGAVFNAGKNPDKVRYNIKDCRDFKTINGRRIFVVYFNEEMNIKYRKKLKFLEECYTSQNEFGI